MEEDERDLRNLTERELLILVNHKVGVLDKKFEGIETRMAKQETKQIVLEEQVKGKAALWGTVSAIVTSVIAGVVSAFANKN